MLEAIVLDEGPFESDAISWSNVAIKSLVISFTSRAYRAAVGGERACNVCRHRNPNYY